ncbi:hypothetical protein BBJ29_008073 [Phytophthora kernoviae]|uniref:Uncharacterized protein n=1 Tax=Phytophthora kernoviae TaxID=325452 RepID=A0A3F2REA6_9STRA|nr:hypothetical protein BBJ29_008073 [Phytophthora kernoviae]RLN54607.1 hypothetical protein BBP00_00008870 [Phytophthora kernoviae]
MSGGSSNVSTDATQCAYEQVGDGDSCYVEPRSCYDCLNTPLSNGQECVLTPYGLCQNISSYDYTEDYRRAQSASTYPIHYNYFPTVNATYCEANDTVCNSCKESVFTVGNRNPSAYCTGTNDCVCVAICESEAWWNDTLARLATLLTETNETTTCPLAANSSSTSASAADTSASKGLTEPAIKDAYAADDECMWYQNSTLCETPRTCYDCLNTALYSGQKCTITPGGYCTTINAYDYTLDYRRMYSDNAAHYFPSTNTTYCEFDDTTCTKCRTYNFKDAYSGHHNLSAYCVGDNDCVCVAFCESPNWKTIVTEEACEATPSTRSSSGYKLPAIGVAAIIMIGVLLGLSALLQLFNMFRTRRREVRWQNIVAQSISVRRQPTSGLTLELSAWKEMRNGLIDDERNVSSADFIGPRLADAPNDSPMVIVEEGEGDGIQCVITNLGLCTTMDEYVWQEDYRLNASEAAPHFFPSTNTTYCQDNDPICTACDSNQFINSASGSTDPSQYCVGANDCVCVGFCNSPVYSNKVSSQYCSTLSYTSTVNVMGVSVKDIITIVIVCFTVPVAVYLWWVRRLRRHREVREEAYRNRPPLNGPLLPLVGWKKHRADLMAIQTATVGVEGDTEGEIATPVAAAQEAGNGIVVPVAPLMNLQVAQLSVEFEDPEHPLTAVTRTGRRRSSMDNTNVVRAGLSDLIVRSSEEDDENDARTTPYSQLEDRAARV